MIVAARVKPEVNAFFSTVRIKLGDVRDGSLGVYDGSAVVLATDLIHPDRDVLIHELLHDYRDRVPRLAKPDEAAVSGRAVVMPIEVELSCQLRFATPRVGSAQSWSAFPTTTRNRAWTESHWLSRRCTR
jgi:hypothetical protein